jgi:phospholipid/cholesterol/gamma-HCH transport system permease protein
VFGRRAREDTGATQGKLQLVQGAEQLLVLRLSGPWNVSAGIPPSGPVLAQLKSGTGLRRVAIDAASLQSWDSGLLAFLAAVHKHCLASDIAFDAAGLPEGARRLLDMAAAVPARKDTERVEERADFLTLVGRETISGFRSGGRLLEFLGETILSVGRLLRGSARFRASDLSDIALACSASALPIVTLISFLIGLILAFVGAVQLQQFGAQIYVADLVTIAMAREMGAVMTGIIMAGRTGAAFAAQLGTMQVNEEIDALSTFGLSPMDFLVLPRMLALIIMMPLLTIYADLAGILGGAFVGLTMLDLSITEYVRETLNSTSLMDFAIGIFKGAVFGVLIAVAGCLRGMECGRSASAVGLAATSAVVTGIVFIIVTDGIFAVLTNALGI